MRWSFDAHSCDCVGKVPGFTPLSGVDVNGTPYVEGGRLLTARPTTLTRMGIALNTTQMGERSGDGDGNAKELQTDPGKRGPSPAAADGDDAFESTLSSEARTMTDDGDAFVIPILLMSPCALVHNHPSGRRHCPELQGDGRHEE
jgi:hypothetical protein